MNLKTTVIFALLISGISALLLSTIYENSTIAFIGLGLTLWGLLINYISHEKYVKQEILDTTSTPLLSNLNLVLTEMGYNGETVYLPPKMLEDFESNKIFITKDRDFNFNYKEILRRINQESVFVKNPEGLLIDPPGSHLLKLFESQSGMKFTRIELNHLQGHLKKILVDLQIAKDVEIESNNETTVKVRLLNTIFDETIQTIDELTNKNSLEPPLCSAIACALAKVTGKPLIIENIDRLDKNKNEITLKFLEPIQKIENQMSIPKIAENQYIMKKSLKGQKFSLQKLLKKIELPMITLGSILLIFSGFITVYDTLVWNKDIMTILFGSRIDESISLGIGFLLFYYIIIGLLLFITALIMIRRKGD